MVEDSIQQQPQTQQPSPPLAEHVELRQHLHLLNGDVSQYSSTSGSVVSPQPSPQGQYSGSFGEDETPTSTPLMSRDDLIGGSDKKKKNKKIKRAMKHIKKLYVAPDSVTSEKSTLSNSLKSFTSVFTSMLPNTNPKSREQDFHKLFKSLPEGETLIQDFSCALLRDILVQGRLYVSQNWFCFYANILGWETLLTIEVRKITSIKKEKTALVINNAISISTSEEKYFFSSFMSRDSAYTHMSNIWRTSTNKLADEDMLQDDMSDNSYLSDDEEEDMDPVSPLEHHHHHHHQRPSPSLLHVLPPFASAATNNNSQPVVVGLMVPSEHAQSSRGVVGETASFNEEDETCACVSHFANEHLNQDFDMSIDKMYKLLFNDDSTVQSKMRTMLKAEEYSASPWTDSTEGLRERTLNYRVPLNANLGPKWAEVIEKQVLLSTSVPTKFYVVSCEVTNPNVPYGDKFNIVKRYCLTRSGDKTCKLRMTSDVQYKKGVWGMVKSIIEKNSKEGINDYCEDLCMCLQEESAGPGIKIRKSTSSAGAHTSASSTRVSRPRSVVAVPESSSRLQTTVSYVTENYIAFILLMMAMLLILNLVLVYRLSSTAQTCTSQFDIINSLPASAEGRDEWVRILHQQQELHKKEIERWQEVLKWISKLVTEVHVSLDKLQKSSIYTPPSSWGGEKSEL